MNKIIKTMLVSVLVNIFLAIIKIIGGLLGQSGALIADGLHSLSDLTTDAIAMIGGNLSLKPADKKHPFGHGKIEYLTSILIAIVILTLGFLVIAEGISKQIVIPQMWVLSISVLTIIVKMLLSTFVIKVGKKTNNQILIASGKESKADALGSIAVLLSIIIMQLSQYWEVLKYADMITIIIVGLLIIKTGYYILKDNIGVLLDEQITDFQYLHKIKQTILSNKEVLKIESLHILKYGPYYKLDSIVVMDNNLPLEKVNNIINNIEKEVKKTDEKIKYVMIKTKPNI